VFACELFCVFFAYFVLFEDIEFAWDVAVLLFIALGARSFRLLFVEDVLLLPGRLADVVLAAAGRFEFAALAATTPLLLKTPGLALAATVGFPWFTDASCARFVLAACSCCVCAAVG
jgi:hypothetical protein